eukprot:14158978-Ditylum_brightwellii.AAC.1
MVSTAFQLKLLENTRKQQVRKRQWKRKLGFALHGRKMLWDYASLQGRGYLKLRTQDSDVYLTKEEGVVRGSHSTKV